MLPYILEKLRSVPDIDVHKSMVRDEDREQTQWDALASIKSISFLILKL